MNSILDKYTDDDIDEMFELGGLDFGDTDMAEDLADMITSDCIERIEDKEGHLEHHRKSLETTPEGHIFSRFFHKHMINKLG
jgi:hypothetical protein